MAEGKVGLGGGGTGPRMAGVAGVWRGDSLGLASPWCSRYGGAVLSLCERAFRRTSMANSLDLDDDLDTVEVVRLLEKVFDVQVSDEEAARTHTVGDFHDLLLLKLPQGERNHKCASAMTFYRLRTALERLGYGAGLAPSSDVWGLEAGRTKANLSRLAEEARLALPGPVFSAAGKWLLFVLYLAGVVAAYALDAKVGVLIGAVLFGWLPAFVAARDLDGGRLSPDCQTLAGLTRKAALLNFGRLVKEGARCSEDDVWRALVEVLSGFSGKPAPEIARDTYLLHSALKRQSAA